MVKSWEQYKKEQFEKMKKNPPKGRKYDPKTNSIIIDESGYIGPAGRKVKKSTSKKTKKK